VGRVSGAHTPHPNPLPASGARERATPIAPQARLRALAATATIGTDRLGGDAAAVESLLTEAAACGLRARAGWRPRILTGSLAPCPPDERPVAPAPAIARLHMLLAERDAGLIDEWATLAVSNGVRVDGATAPLLLDWWAHQAKRPAAVFAALGRQGEWLASLNPDWAHRAPRTDVPPDAETRWQTGSNDERITLLTSLRRLDPARALAFVQSTWDADSAAERQRFVDVLQEQASMADEPFLEAALDDRSKAVRRQAAAVLVRVPGSRLRQRLSEAARRFISIESREDGTTIALQPPESFDTAWERDGIQQTPPKGVGQRAWWLRQIVASADLAIWTERSTERPTDRHTQRPTDRPTERHSLTPSAVLDALQGDDFAADAVFGFVAAARIARDAEWSAALARHLLRQPPPVQIDAIGALLEVLTGADAERLALEIAAVDSLGTIERWVTLTAIDWPWSFDFSRDVMTLVINHTPSLSGADAWRASQLVEAVSRRLEPQAIDLFEHAVTRSFSLLKPDTIARHVDRVRVRAEMRAEMRKEFSS
jgi:Family of unknown function (DUF5691)